MNERREPQLSNSMSLEELHEARNYWIREMQRTFFPEAGTASRSLQVCEANLREIDRLVSEFHDRRVKSTGKNSRLPFDIDNPLEFGNHQDE